MPAGRPRTISLSREEMIALGKEMIDFVIRNEPVHLSEFYCINKGFTDKEWDTMHVAPEFFPYYEKALKLVGLKYLKKDSEVEPSLKHRWQRIYFKDLKQLEDDDKVFEANLKTKQEQEPSNSETIDHENEKMLLRAQIAQLQEKLDNQSKTRSELS